MEYAGTFYETAMDTSVLIQGAVGIILIGFLVLVIIFLLEEGKIVERIAEAAEKESKMTAEEILDCIDEHEKNAND